MIKSFMKGLLFVMLSFLSNVISGAIHIGLVVGILAAIEWFRGFDVFGSHAILTYEIGLLLIACHALGQMQDVWSRIRDIKSGMRDIKSRIRY